MANQSPFDAPQGAEVMLESGMRLKRTGLAVLALGAVVGAGALGQNEAMAKGRCASGQILRVSTGTCVARETAVQQGIIGGKRKVASETTAARKHRKVQDEAEAHASDEAETTKVARAAPEPAPRRPVRADRPERQTLSDAPQVASTESPEAAPVRIEVVKTEPRPTPDRFMPTWPYGELAAFPKRTTP